MSKTQNYTQCLLTRKHDDLTQTHVAWIPSELARVGKRVIVEHTETIGMDWIISEVYGKKEAKEAETRSRDYLNQRKASDI